MSAPLTAQREADIRRALAETEERDRDPADHAIAELLGELDRVRAQRPKTLDDATLALADTVRLFGFTLNRVRSVTYPRFASFIGGDLCVGVHKTTEHWSATIHVADTLIVCGSGANLEDAQREALRQARRIVDGLDVLLSRGATG